MHFFLIFLSSLVHPINVFYIISKQLCGMVGWFTQVNHYAKRILRAEEKACSGHRNDRHRGAPRLAPHHRACLQAGGRCVRGIRHDARDPTAVQSSQSHWSRWRLLLGILLLAITRIAAGCRSGCDCDRRPACCRPKPRRRRQHLPPPLPLFQPDPSLCAGDPCANRPRCRPGDRGASARNASSAATAPATATATVRLLPRLSPELQPRPRSPR